MSQRAFGSIAASGLTPLLDTVFLLLFFFLTIAELPIEDDAAELVRLELPAVEPRTDVSDAQGEVLEIVVDAQSLVRVPAVDQSVGSRAELDQALDQALAGTSAGDRVVEIRADRDARHGVAVELLEHLRRRGFTEVRLVAEGAAQAADPFGGPSGGARSNAPGGDR